MDAIVLVGGQGTRLRPLTLTTPKPMLPTAGVPFLLHLLTRAHDAGVDHAILSTSYDPGLFEGYFGDGSALGLRITYVAEAEPLGTGGGIRNAADHLRGQDFLVFNGDVLSGADLHALVARHQDGGAQVTLQLTEVEDPRAFGMVPVDAGGAVTAFLEKPKRPEDIVTNRINAGCYVFAPSVLDLIAPGQKVSVERDVFPVLLAAGARVLGFVDTGYWLDVGTPESFVRGSTDLVLGRVASSAVPSGVSAGVLVLPGAVVAPDAMLIAGTTIGAGCSVGAGAIVEGSVVFDDAVIEAGAVIRASVVGRGAHVGSQTSLDGVLVGDGARIGSGNELRTGARVWPDAVIGDAAIRFSS